MVKSITPTVEGTTCGFELDHFGRKVLLHQPEFHRCGRLSPKIKPLRQIHRPYGFNHFNGHFQSSSLPGQLTMTIPTVDAEDNVGESAATEAPKDKTPSKLRRRGPEVADFWWSICMRGFHFMDLHFSEISTAALNRLAIFYFLCFSIWLGQASTTMWLRRVWISIWVKDDSQTKDLSLSSDGDAGWIDPQRLPYAILVAFPHCSTKHELQLPAVALPCCPRVGVRWSRAGIDRHGSPYWEGHGSQAMNQAASGWNDNDLLEPRSKRSARIDQVADVEGLIFRNRSRVACHGH